MTRAAAPSLRWAEIIAVGTELLVPPRVDTNSLYITERLNEYGIEVRAKTVVGDRRGDLESALRAALARTELVVLCGGLGPTDDDVTRDAVAAVIARPLEEDGGVVDSIRRRFAARGARMPEINRRQAMVPRGAALLPNVLGTAPGLWIEHDGRVVVLLPGPPGELKPMFECVVASRLAPMAGDSRLHRRVLRICGRTESEVDEATAPVYSRWVHEEPAVFTTVLTSPAQVELHVTTRMASASAASARLDAATAEVAAVLGPDLYSTDGRTLEETVGTLLRERGWRIAVAESCTGGLVSSRLTDVPGSSDYVTLNVVCYSNESKVSWLGVPQSALDTCGAVSESVAEAMADGVRQRAGASLGIGVTGIAGPGGGTEAKPVGTVVIAVTTAERRMVRTFRFPVGRTRVRQCAAQMALDLARRVLVGAGGGGAFVVTGGTGGRA
jgi:nicotinamide-nucleotide amidase